jgi:anaerobic magnesium-protoporphyrin IX monomethyl ester cyclase
VFRERARLPSVQPFGARSGEAQARFDLTEVARSEDDELAIWHELVRGQRHVSRAAYHALAKSLPPLRPSPRRYRFTAGEPPVPSRAGPRGRRPPNASNAAG